MSLLHLFASSFVGESPLNGTFRYDLLSFLMCVSSETNELTKKRTPRKFKSEIGIGLVFGLELWPFRAKMSLPWKRQVSVPPKFPAQHDKREINVACGWHWGRSLLSSARSHLTFNSYGPRACAGFQHRFLAASLHATRLLLAFDWIRLACRTRKKLPEEMKWELLSKFRRKKKRKKWTRLWWMISLH